MKKISILFFISIFTILISTNLSYSRSLKEILKDKKIIIGMYYKDEFPFFFHDIKGNFTGLDVDISKEIGKELNVRVIFNRKAKSFNELIDLLQSDEIDLIISWFSRTLKRSMKIKFSIPYFIDYQTIILNRLKYAQLNRSNFDTNNLDAKEVSICTVKETSYADFLKDRFLKANLILDSTWESCFNRVLKGEVIAGLWTKTGILKNIIMHPENNLQIKIINLNKKDYICIGINAEYELLWQWVNLFLKFKNFNYTPHSLISKYLKYQ